MIADHLLELLEGVKRTGQDRWLAKCPAHGDRTASLSIRETDDSRVLVHCFAGCSVHEVVAAVGLEITDLFPPRPAYDRPGKPERRPIPAADAIRCLTFEGMVIAAAGRSFLSGKWNEAEQSRLVDALGRISAAMTACGVTP